jgi:hypothetical protein
MDTGMQTEDSNFSDKATKTDSLDKAIQTEDIDSLGQIKRVNMILIDAVSILSNTNFFIILNFSIFFYSDFKLG